MYENITQTQISLLKGLRKLNTPGFCLTGFLIIILIPSDMNGLLKSMTRSRSDVIVIGAIATSASYNQTIQTTVRRHVYKLNMMTTIWLLNIYVKISNLVAQ